MLARVMELEGDFNVLIIDDASPDGTAERVKAIQQNFPGRVSLIERRGN
jgi:Glycosyl transferase family 2.